MTLMTNDIAELSGVVNLTSADVMLDTDGRDCSFKNTFSLTLQYLYCMNNNFIICTICQVYKLYETFLLLFDNIFVFRFFNFERFLTSLSSNISDYP